MNKENVEHIYNGILFSHKKKKTSSLAAWMEVEDIRVGEISQTENDKYHMFSFICRR
jgi:hypothetical protein